MKDFMSKTIVLNPTSWHFKLYLLARTFRSNLFLFNGSDYDYIDKVNVCEYMRNILIWLPLYVGFTGAYYAWLLYVFFWFPVVETSALGLNFLGMILGIILLTLTAMAIIGVFVYGGHLINEHYVSRKDGVDSKFEHVVDLWKKSRLHRFCVDMEVK